MFDFHEKRKLRSYVYSKPVALGLFLVAIFLSTSVYDRYLVARDMAGKREALEAELHELKGRASALEEEVERLKSDRGIEEEIRDRYEVSKAGEEVVVIVGSDKKETHKSTSTVPSVLLDATTTEETSFWGSLW